jgi:hypothetical protein
MKTYKITLTFTNPYIGSRNGGNKTLTEGLTLKQAKKELLDLFNRKSEHFAITWTEAKRKTKNCFDQALGSGETARFEFDSRIFKIEVE